MIFMLCGSDKLDPPTFVCALVKMAHRAFRNNRQIQQFILTDVTPTGKTLGTGSYGSVEEVKK